ncbi:MAG: hypothetical protein JNL12_02315 [Planctomycetes bacterium]|nr:hypothetical protein [Planctomycetota bacterium]
MPENLLTMKESLRKWSNWIIGAAAVAFVLGMWFWVRSQLPEASAAPDQWTIAGTRGDAFGAINALFSGLAFAGFLLALKMQRDELAEQRKESEAAREEARNHTAATNSLRLANLLGVKAQLQTTLGRANDYGPTEIADLRRVLSEVEKQLKWEPLPEDLELAEHRSRCTTR